MKLIWYVTNYVPLVSCKGTCCHATKNCALCMYDWLHLVGVVSPQTLHLKVSKPTAQAESTGSRFEVERVGVFEDNLAYNDRRGIYIIKDTQTEKEYVGVSGIGISELGSHLVTTSSGKTTTARQVPHEQ